MKVEVSKTSCKLTEIKKIKNWNYFKMLFIYGRERIRRLKEKTLREKERGRKKKIKFNKKQTKKKTLKFSGI